MPSVKTGARRLPVQARSQARVERILEAATALVEEDGVEAATTRAIAARAGVPVATLYQFFADRDAVLDEVLRRELEALDRHVSAASEEARAGGAITSLAAFVGFGFEVHRAYYRSRPAFARLWFGGRRSSPVEAAVRDRGRRLARDWHGVMIAAGLIDPAAEPIVSELAVELGDRVFECAYRREPEVEDTLFAEGKRALTAYLQQYAR
ncbi:MAG: TetR/AcrR family transcriptional regulator [Actinomycetota bacterium]|jgi:AcrR family transcriptional regulator